MDINNEVENMNITSWKDADENVQDKMMAEIENCALTYDHHDDVLQFLAHNKIQILYKFWAQKS